MPVRGAFSLPSTNNDVQDELCPFVADLRLPSLLHLASHRFKASLYPVDPYRKNIDQVEALGVIGRDGSEHAWHNISQLDKVPEQTSVYQHLQVESIFPRSGCL